MDLFTELLPLLLAFFISTESTRCQSLMATGDWQLMSPALSDYVSIPQIILLVPYSLMFGLSASRFFFLPSKNRSLA